MGGWSALEQVKSQEIQSSGTDWEPLQAIEPTAEPRQINSFNQVLQVDFANKRMRLTFDASRTYPTPAPVQFVEVISDNAGMLVDSNERLHPSRLATRLRDYDRLPTRLLFTARDATDLTRAEDRVVEGVTVQVLKYTDGGTPAEIQIDTRAKIPVRVVYMEDDPVYGDTPNELVFSDWREYGGVRLPETQITLLDGKKVREEHVRSLILNPPLGETLFEIPESVRAQPEDGQRIVSQWVLRRVAMGVAYQDFGREQKVELVPVTNGVFHIRGGSHHSMVIEMRDHLIVVEAPLFDERSLAVIRTLEERFPNKPIKNLIVTHFHFDHTGGVRAYVAKGATILAHDSILEFLNEMIQRPHTLRPDSLARERLTSTITPSIGRISPVQVLTDGQRRVEVRDIPNDHATGMSVAYLPRERIVFVADLYSPPGPTPNPSVIFERGRAQAFYDALKASRLSVETIVGGHGGVGTLRELEEALAAAR